VGDAAQPVEAEKLGGIRCGRHMQLLAPSGALGYTSSRLPAIECVALTERQPAAGAFVLWELITGRSGSPMVGSKQPARCRRKSRRSPVRCSLLVAALAQRILLSIVVFLLRAV